MFALFNLGWVELVILGAVPLMAVAVIVTVVLVTRGGKERDGE
jgi:hypothetical protein